jgi:pectin methylesterase-like acyl-CoA thioesterase
MSGETIVAKWAMLLALLAWNGAVAARKIKVSLTDPAAYHSVQAAIDALPESGGDITIAPGRYREKLFVTRSGVHLRGLGNTPSDVVLVYGDAAATAGGTFKSATLTAPGDDFRLDNLTVQNDYWLDPAHPPSQAVALAVTGDRDVFDHVRLLGHQDTLYANKGPGGRMARQYFRNCYVEGHVDFIFGNAKAFFDRCEIHGLPHGSVMYTAQSKNAPDEDSGYVFDHCRLTADPGAQDIALGRAWRPYATVVFLDTQMDAPIIKQGWREWHPSETTTLTTAYYAEYRSTGPGASPATREPLSHQLTDAEAARWRLPSFFAGDTGWIRHAGRK